MWVWIINISAVVLLVIACFRCSGLSTKWAVWYVAAIVLKIASGMLVGYYYRCAGGGDTWMYHEQAEIIADFFKSDPLNLVRWLGGNMPPLEGLSIQGQPRSLFFAALVALTSMATGGGYWLVALYFSIFNLLAAWYLVAGLARKYPDVALSAAIAFLFFPSVLFWGSGVLKESLANGALFVLAGILVRGKPANNPVLILRLLLGVLMVLLLWRLRYFYAAMLLPAIFAYATAGMISDSIKRGLGGDRVWYAVFFIVWTGAVISASRLHYNLRFEHVSSVIYHNYLEFVVRSEPGRFIAYGHISPDVGGVLLSLPKACFSAIFRPNIWDYSHAMQIPLIIENAILLAAVAALAVHRRSYALLFRRQVVAVLWFALPAISLIALACPNYGSLVRYRSGALAFIVFICAEGIRRVYFDRPPGPHRTDG